MFVPDALFFYRHCQQRASAYALPTKGAALPLPIASACLIWQSFLVVSLVVSFDLHDSSSDMA